MALFPCVCSVCVCVYNFFGRTTGRILMSDSSFDRKCPREKTFTIVDIDFFRKSISIDRYIDFRSINVSIFDKFSKIAMLHIILDQFWALNIYNPTIFFSIRQYFFRKSISIDRNYTNCTIDKSYNLSIKKIFFNKKRLH